ncbi:hypothetical protein B4119_1922 [Parageobacillus caldoxylosilyticus]|uniref:Uncharacterized protein n=1 Tax=Saccharococcus caldoxylosilyticus TaxID=81408 RepID=A0A150LW46_9BACL|nr:hypothetical protein B4119_1922 [Parageobacillus caldoxylosilyticus]
MEERVRFSCQSPDEQDYYRVCAKYEFLCGLSVPFLSIYKP